MIEIKIQYVTTKCNFNLITSFAINQFMAENFAVAGVCLNCYATLRYGATLGAPLRACRHFPRRRNDCPSGATAGKLRTT